MYSVLPAVVFGSRHRVPTALLCYNFTDSLVIVKKTTGVFTVGPVSPVVQWKASKAKVSIASLQLGAVLGTAPCLWEGSSSIWV